ncbi:MAG: hypothetical protein MZV65_34255 [Chromatiales bacterium]|nr:hypothetical protein [Chromatiales bacterium]
MSWLDQLRPPQDQDPGRQVRREEARRARGSVAQVPGLRRGCLSPAELESNQRRLPEVQPPHAHRRARPARRCSSTTEPRTRDRRRPRARSIRSSSSDSKKYTRPPDRGAARRPARRTR